MVVKAALVHNCGTNLVTGVAGWLAGWRVGTGGLRGEHGLHGSNEVCWSLTGLKLALTLLRNRQSRYFRPYHSLVT